MAKICQTWACSQPLENPACQPSDRLPRAPFRFRYGAAALALFLLSCLSAGLCRAQSRDVVCREGQGDFDAEHPTGVKAHVGAERTLELATRACDAVLSWGDQNLVVASGTAELDLDAFGVDLGMGAPVAAFQVKKSKADCCMEYKI